MPAKRSIEERDGVVLIRARVQPKASRNSISIAADGGIRVSTTAPPQEGKANSATEALLAKRRGVSRASVSVVSGKKSRDKTFAVQGTTLDDVRARLFHE
ncbi:MAG: DUF167 domain-containing protein [Candidatus Hydrogenedentes bacterium]|nr:DUF167 domain-containing protein [Candidatus Hydrogenedentota bacterium]